MARVPHNLPTVNAATPKSRGIHRSVGADAALLQEMTRHDPQLHVLCAFTAQNAAVQHGAKKPQHTRVSSFR
jgi:hypothetical protein